MTFSYFEKILSNNFFLSDVCANSLIIWNTQFVTTFILLLVALKHTITEILRYLSLANPHSNVFSSYSWYSKFVSKWEFKIFKIFEIFKIFKIFKISVSQSVSQSVSLSITNYTKYKLHIDDTVYLSGQKISQDGVTPNKNNLKGVQKNIEQIQSLRISAPCRQARQPLTRPGPKIRPTQKTNDNTRSNLTACMAKLTL